MAIGNVDRLYPGRGIANMGAPQDSGAVVKSATPATVTVTVPALSDATQPIVDHGQAVWVATALNASAVIGQVDFYASDGTNTEYVGTIPATAQATTGQGASYLMDIFSSLVNITTIKTLTARSNTTGNNNYTAELRFNYGT